MKKTQIDSLYAISFSLLYIFMEQFFFPTNVAIVVWIDVWLHYSTVLYYIMSNQILLTQYIRGFINSTI